MERYKNYFDKIKLFKREQDKQKQRGLNNYNILTSVLSKSDEVRLHSRMIFSLLDPGGKHYQGSLFLDKFLKVLNIRNFHLDSQSTSIYKEYQNIDLYITDGDKHIIIENKIYAKDQKDQLKRYIKTVQSENVNSNSDDILVIYLTIDKQFPSSYSLGDLKIENNIIKKNSEDIALFKAIHYKHEVLQWLKFCQYEVQNITNLNEVFKQYIDVVKMINNQYKDKVMNLSDYIKENESIYKMAVEIGQALPRARQSVIDNFFQKIILSLESALGDEWTIESVGDYSTRNGFPLRVYKNKWIGTKKNNIIFGFEFNKHNYYDGYFGIVRQNGNVDIKGDIFNQYKQEINALGFKLKTSSWWLHWEWLPNIDGVDDFAEYVMFNEDAEEEFLKSILNFIKIFEIDSNLMTDINEYLNNKTI